MRSEDNPSPDELLRSLSTRVVGHRGSPTKALENTFESFDRAEADGADAFELDVRLTLDGEAVVHHDADIFLGSRRVPLATVTIPELNETRIVRGEFQGSVPTLRDVFLRYGSSGRYLVELKTGPSPRPGLLEFRVAALLAQFALLENSLVLSFSLDALRRIREIEPRVADVPQLRRHGPPARRAALARSSEGVRCDRPERRARLRRALCAREGRRPLGPRLDGERRRARRAPRASGCRERNLGRRVRHRAGDPRGHGRSRAVRRHPQGVTDLRPVFRAEA